LRIKLLIIERKLVLKFKNRHKKTSSESEGKNGGPSTSQSQEGRPPFQVIDTIRLFEPKLYEDKSFLHQKYVIEGLSIKQIANEIMSSTSTVRKWLIHFGIELRSKSQHHGNRA
jgi:hypothetical protein